MDFEYQWLLLGLPLFFILGWLGSRFDLRQLKRETRDSPKAYYKGLSLLLNEQQDKAIDAFIEAVQNDPDTQELHFALGNLFRRRGEFERSVRVHQHLLVRADLSQAERERAQHAVHPFGVGTRGFGLLLGAAQLRRRHHLHGGGDFLRRLHAVDTGSKRLQTGHRM